MTASDKARRLVQGLVTQVLYRNLNTTIETCDETEAMRAALLAYIARLESVAADARLRLRTGHSDTCGHMLSAEYECSCGHDPLDRALRALDGDGGGQ